VRDCRVERNEVDFAPLRQSWFRLLFLGVELLPLLLIHSKPVVGNFQIQIAIANGRLLQALIEASELAVAT